MCTLVLPQTRQQHNTQILNTAALHWRYRDLSTQQRALMILLRRHAATSDEPLPQSVIIRELWGPHAGDDMQRNLYVLVCNTKARLKALGLAESPVAVYGKGYLWAGGDA